MVASTVQLINRRQATRPKFWSLYFVIPLTLGAVWFADIRPASGHSGLVVNLSLLCLCGALAAGLLGRRQLQRAICLFATCAAIIVLLRQFSPAPQADPDLQSAAQSAEAYAVIYVSLAIALLSLRSHSLVYAFLVIFMAVQIVQFAAMNLYIAVADLPDLPLPLRVSPFGGSVHVIIGATILIQAMMRPTASDKQARIWPPAAAVSALVAVLVSLFVLDSGFAAIVAAVSGALLITAAYLGCSAAITRRAMFRLHLRLKRELRSQQRQKDILYAIQADYEELFEEVPTGVLKSLMTGQIIGANSRMCDLLGYASVEQLKATDLRALFADPDRRHRDFITWQNSGLREWSGDVEMLKRDGGTIIARFTGCRVNDQLGNLRYMLYCYRDVTEDRQTARDKEKLEGELRLMHKLEAVGRLAAGVAHEVNTPMQYIGDNVHFLSSAYEDLRALVQSLTALLRQVAKEIPGCDVDELIGKLEGEADLKYLDESVPGSFERTLEGVGNVADIVLSMKQFAYPNDNDQSTQDINELLRKSLTVCRSMYASVAEVVADYGDLPGTLCYAGALSQVFINLVINAAHAIEKANGATGRSMGEICIATRDVGNSIEVRISDNGCGMPDAVRERIFDPFFTTKEVGKGTGQGLAIAHSIVTEKHGGSIAVESEPDVGTTFTIMLPIRRADQSLNV